MPDSFFSLPFVQNASGPFGYFIAAVSLSLLLYDRYSKWAAARKNEREAGGEGARRPL